MNALKVSFVIPAHNEEDHIKSTLTQLLMVLRREGLCYQIVVVNDNSSDRTGQEVASIMESDPDVHLLNRTPPPGFGRAVRAGLEWVEGDAVILYMADGSDDPEDAVQYCRRLEEGYDCVFGSRFIRGGKVKNYPIVKLVLNRIVNRLIQVMFWTKHNDLTNAFKAYRTHVIRECGPYRASHFNVTIEMSLGALIRNYSISVVPIKWNGRYWGSSHLKLSAMGRRYLSTLIKLFFERILVRDDIMAEVIAARAQSQWGLGLLNERLKDLDERIVRLERSVYKGPYEG